jgi:hypothetical protein
VTDRNFSGKNIPVNNPRRPDESVPEPAPDVVGADPLSQAAPAAADEVVKKLTPEEQMALYEEHLKETDWGHQPC